MSTIRIISGSYRNKPVNNQIFTLVKGYQVGKKGNYITVKNEGHFDINIDTVKVQVQSINDIEFLSSNSSDDQSTKEIVMIPSETDDQAMDRIATRFSILDEMSAACINGDIRAMIVSGPPGVGKSFGVESQLEKASLFDKLSGRKVRFEIVKGAMTPLGLYAQLYKFSDPKNVLVFDDCDSAFSDELALNILKAALDSGKRRRIFWNSDSAMLRREGIPDSFEFNGSVIFITNLDFENVRSKKIADHLEALQSRCHYLDLTINSDRDKMLRIRQVHRDVSKDKIGGLFADYDFNGNESEEILEFMWNNRTKMREVSLRMALKIADLVKINPSNWKILTENTCMRSN